jgi:hypothetical protein
MHIGAKAFFLALLTAMLVATSFAIIVEAANWQPTTSFTGSESQTTNEFMVNGNDWRITWTYTPNLQYPDLTAFSFFVYRHGETSEYVGHVIQYGSDQTSGTLSLHDGTGLHYIRIETANTQGYSLAVEYDAASVSSDSDIFLIVSLVLGIPIILSVVILVLVRKRVKRRRLLVNSFPPPPPPPK